MRIGSKDGLYEIVVTREELKILASCLNEALELVPSEFQTRTGYNREEAQALMTGLLEAVRNN